MKIFDVVTFDMTDMMAVDYDPGACVWISRRGAPVPKLAIADVDEPIVRVCCQTPENWGFRCVFLRLSRVWEIESPVFDS